MVDVAGENAVIGAEHDDPEERAGEVRVDYAREEGEEPGGGVAGEAAVEEGGAARVGVLEVEGGAGEVRGEGLFC